MQAGAKVALFLTRFAAPFMCIGVIADAHAVEVSPEEAQIEVDVRATLHQFSARVGSPRIELEVDPDGPAITAATFSFLWTNVRTGNVTRDREMLEWADARNHPEGVFTLEQLVPDQESFSARGSLFLHGQRRQVEFPVQIASESGILRVSGEFELDFRDWGLPAIRRLGFFSVQPVVTVRIMFGTRISLE